MLFTPEPASHEPFSLRSTLGNVVANIMVASIAAGVFAASPQAVARPTQVVAEQVDQEIQLDMFASYESNVAEYPNWQKLFRDHQPPALILWGKNDQIFPAEGAHPYKRGLTNVEFHQLDTGHFALEEYGDQVARDILDFLDREVRQD